jgi:predicted SprT family Zn-dependent metalloprotease
MIACRSETAMANSSGPSVKSPGRKANKLSTDLLSAALKKRANDWIRQWRVPTLLNQTSVRRNNLLRTTVARWRENEKCLELGPRFFRMRRRQDEILCHELAHAAAVRVHGRGVSPHGPEWQALIAAVGYSPSPVFKTSKSISQIPQRNESSWYEHRCPVCHAVRFAKKSMKQWRCAECSQHGLQGLLRINKLTERP